MSSYNMARSEGLTKAMEFWRENRPASDEQILATAEKFRAFLEGETATPERFSAEDKRPLFKLPSLHDDFVYFQFRDTDILYRSDAGYGADAVGSVQRISPRCETEWQNTNGSALDTRRKLRDADEYHEIRVSKARDILRQNLKGVRFA